MPQKKKTQEKTLHQVWLAGLAKLVKASLLPDYNLSTVAAYGFPAGRTGDDTRGACYIPKSEGEGKNRVIFIHPSEWVDPKNVVRTFIHEAVHSVLPADAGHGQLFQDAAGAIGLGGELYDTPNSKLAEWIDQAIATLPPMPSDPLGREKPPKPQKGRMKLWECTCGFKIRCGKSTLDARCNRCNSDFELQEKEGKQ